LFSSIRIKSEKPSTIRKWPTWLPSCLYSLSLGTHNIGPRQKQKDWPIE
jgi:hypothetical protein